MSERSSTTATMMRQGSGELGGSAPATPEIGPAASSPHSSSRTPSSANTTPRQHNRRRTSSSIRLERRSSSTVSVEQQQQQVPLSATTIPSSKVPSSVTQEYKAIQFSNRPLPTPKSPSQCPLLCCFYAEFDNKVGPRICYQSPEGFMEQDIRLKATELEQGLHRVFDGTDEAPQESSATQGDPNTENRSVDGGDDDDAQFQIFNSCSEYIITGNELTGNILNLSTHHCHILTRPTSISNEKYERNALLFCVGFVLRRSEDPRPFRPALSKVATTLRDMEVESQFLSHTDAGGHRPQIRSLLTSILVSLNSEACECNILLGKSNNLNLKLFRPPRTPAVPVQDHTVPVLLRRDWQVQTYDWDLSINWVSLHIDGMANALQISKKAEVDMEMVRACLRVLSHHGVIALVDMFFYSNRYECTEKVASLFSESGDSKLLQKAVEFVVKRRATTGSSLSGIATRNSELSPELHSTSPRARMLDPNQSHMMSSSFQPDSWKEGQLVGIGARRASGASPFSNTQEHFASLVKRDDYNEIRTAVAEFFCALKRTTTIGDLWLSLVSNRPPPGTCSDVNWKKMFHMFDHRRLATFGKVHGLTKRVHAYPMLVGGAAASSTSTSWEPFQDGEHPHFFPGQDRTQAKSYAQLEKRRKIASLAASMMDGVNCDDAIVCACEMPLEEIYSLFPDGRISCVFSTED